MPCFAFQDQQNHTDLNPEKERLALLLLNRTLSIGGMSQDREKNQKASGGRLDLFQAGYHKKNETMGVKQTEMTFLYMPCLRYLRGGSLLFMKIPPRSRCLVASYPFSRSAHTRTHTRHPAKKSIYICNIIFLFTCTLIFVFLPARWRIPIPLALFLLLFLSSLLLLSLTIPHEPDSKKGRAGSFCFVSYPKSNGSIQPFFSDVGGEGEAGLCLWMEGKQTRQWLSPSLPPPSSLPFALPCLKVPQNQRHASSSFLLSSFLRSLSLPPPLPVVPPPIISPRPPGFLWTSLQCHWE